MNRSSYHGKLGPSDESTADVSLSSFGTDSDFFQDRLHGSLDMDKHSRRGLSRHSSGMREQRLEAIVAEDGDDEEALLQDSFAVDDDNNFNVTSFLWNENYVSDVEEVTEEEDSSSRTTDQEAEVRRTSTSSSSSSAVSSSPPTATTSSSKEQSEKIPPTPPSSTEK
mmetsp:Transcript_20243/g.43780  ORF Transcript_20243/g.43780 Transcript_20243/m.43780 type:complete len:167 (+) Transcript_20243:42-542(+)